MDHPYEPYEFEADANEPEAADPNLEELEIDGLDIRDFCEPDSITTRSMRKTLSKALADSLNDEWLDVGFPKRLSGPVEIR